MRPICLVVATAPLLLQCSPPQRDFTPAADGGGAGADADPGGDGGGGGGDGAGGCAAGSGGCTNETECAAGYFGADCDVRFTALGFPSPTDTFARATAVSGDGTTVVGSVGEGTPAAFRWNDGSFDLLGTLTDGIDSEAVAVNGDGSVIVGDAQVSEEGNVTYVAFQWDSGVMTALGLLDNGTFSRATGISADGTHVVGYGDRDGEDRGIRWDSGAIGTVHAIDPIRPLTVSDNGQIVGGFLFAGSPTGVPILFDAPVVTELDIPLNFTGGQVLDVTPNAAIATGFVINGSSLRRAIRWTGTSALSLGTLEGSSEARSISADGSVVVGLSAGQAWIWEMNQGMRPLAEVLSELGVDLTGWTLTEASGVSADGKVIVGTGQRGTRTEAWLAELP